jgi:hypothetical protein
LTLSSSVAPGSASTSGSAAGPAPRRARAAPAAARRPAAGPAAERGSCAGRARGHRRPRRRAQRRLRALDQTLERALVLARGRPDRERRAQHASLAAELELAAAGEQAARDRERALAPRVRQQHEQVLVPQRPEDVARARRAPQERRTERTMRCFDSTP